MFYTRDFAITFQPKEVEFVRHDPLLTEGHRVPPQKICEWNCVLFLGSFTDVPFIQVIRFVLFCFLGRRTNSLSSVREERPSQPKITNPFCFEGPNSDVP